MKEKQSVKRWLAVAMVGMITFLSLAQLHPAKELFVLADETPKKEATTGVYADSELTSVLPSAYYDARNEATSDSDTQEEKKRTLKHNINEIIAGNFGNVGLFLGPATEVDNQYTAFNANLSVDTNGSNDYFSSGDLTGYYHFGQAIHNLSESASNTNASGVEAEETLDALSNSMSSITKLGVRLLNDYNPAPLLFSLYLTEGNNQRTQWMDLPKHVNLNSEKDNKLVKIVQDNPMLRDGLSFLRRPPMGKGNMTLISWVVFGSVILLLISGTVMKAMNGRAAGENYRKALVRIVISVVGIPIVAMILHYGINTFAKVIEPDLSQEEVFADDAIGEHLNLADWYATGFAVPKGIEIVIKDGQFNFTKQDIRAINNYTYSMVTNGTSTIDPDTAKPNPVDVFDRLLAVGGGNNQMDTVFSERSGWDGVNVKVIGNRIKENDEEIQFLDISTIKNGTGNYLKSRNSGTTQGGVTTIRANPGISGANVHEHNYYGVSPLAAHNLMRSSFSSGKISANVRSAAPMTGVAFFTVTDEMGKGINPLVRFVAIMGMVIAALKALATIFTTSFGGIIGGASGTAVGKTSGMGQALGGVIALVGGVLGMGLIMNLSFILLEEISAILFDVFVGVTGEASLLEPLRAPLNALPKWAGFIKGSLLGILNTLGGFVTFFVTLIAVPKFGKIPITLFGEKMAELPGVFAEKAQMMENRFTGDYRGGGAGAGSMSRSISNQVSNANETSMGQLAGMGAAGGALAGMGASALGGSLTNYADSILGDEVVDDSSTANTDDKKDEHTGSVATNAGNIESVAGQENSFAEDHQDNQALNQEDEFAQEVQGDEQEVSKESLSDEQLQEQENAQNASELNGQSGLSHTESIQGEDHASTLESTEGVTSEAGDGSSMSNDSGVSSTNLEGNDMGGIEQSSMQSDELSQEIDGNESVSEQESQLNAESTNSVGGIGESTLGAQPSMGNVSEMNARSGSAIDQSQTSEQMSQTNLAGNEAMNVGMNESSEVHAHSEEMNTSAQNDLNQSKSDSFSQNQRNEQSVASQGGKSAGDNSQSGVSGQPSAGHPTSVHGISGQNPQGQSNTQGAKKTAPLGGKSSTAPGKSRGGMKPTSTDRLSKGKPTMASSPNRVGGVSRPGGVQSTPSNQVKSPQGQTNTSSGNKVSPTRMKMSTAKVLRGLGKGLQSAGGDVSAERGVKAARLAATSAVVGGTAQRRAQKDLDKAQGKTPVANEQVNKDNTPPEKQGNDRRQKNERNERLIEEDRRAQAYENSRR